MISVIINTKNEEKNIGRCLQSLRDQTAKDFEVIVVDNNSTDGTKMIAENFGVRLYDFGPERSEQKNFGVRQARGEYLLFLDADMELTRGVVSSCLSETGLGFDGLIIPEISVGEGFWAQCKSLEKRMYFNDPEIEAPRFFRKNIFEKAGGYAPDMVAGEDWDLREKVKKHGGKIGRIEDPVYHHEGHVTLFSSLRKKFYYGKNSQLYLSKNKPNLFSLIRFIIRPSYWQNIKYLLSDPLHFIGIIFMKSLEFGSGFAGILYAKIL